MSKTPPSSSRPLQSGPCKVAEITYNWRLFEACCFPPSNGDTCYATIAGSTMMCTLLSFTRKLLLDINGTVGQPGATCEAR